MPFNMGCNENRQMFDLKHSEIMTVGPSRRKDNPRTLQLCRKQYMYSRNNIQAACSFSTLRINL